MTVDSVEMAIPGTILFRTERGRTVELRYDARVWTAHKEDLPLTTPEEEGLKETWRHRSITRILMGIKAPVRAAVFQYTIVAR
jgi:hypothetical protein